MTDNTHEFDIENSLQVSTPFQYPQDKLPADILELLQSNVTEQANRQCLEFINLLLTYVLTTQDTRLYLTAFAYAVGSDLSLIYGCENTETALAKKLRVSKQVFSHAVKTICQQHGIVPMNGKQITQDTYARSNYRKLNN